MTTEECNLRHGTRPLPYRSARESSRSHWHDATSRRGTRCRREERHPNSISTEKADVPLLRSTRSRAHHLQRRPLRILVVNQLIIHPHITHSSDMFHRRKKCDQPTPRHPRPQQWPDQRETTKQPTQVGALDRGTTQALKPASHASQGVPR